MKAAMETSYLSMSQMGMSRDYNFSVNELSFDEVEVTRALSEESYSRRTETLEQLRNTVRVSQTLPFRNIISLFRVFTVVLSDTNWAVRRLCLLLIGEYIPLLRFDVDACMGIVIPNLIASVGDIKVVVRKDAIQTLHIYMKHTTDMPALMRRYVQHGLDHHDSRIRKELVIALPLLITAEFSSEDFTDIIQDLSKKLADHSEDETLRHYVLATLKKVREQTGDPKFRSYLQKLPAVLRENYCALTGYTIDQFATENLMNENYHNRQYLTIEELHYGFIPNSIMSELLDQESFARRGNAVEELKRLVERLTNLEAVLPYTDSIINLLNNLLDDTNFKILTVTLDIMGLIVEKMSSEIRQHLKPLISALTKRMGDNKNVIRQAITKVMLQLMQILRPKLVLLLLSDNLGHRNPRVRTETINCIIHALHTFPRYEFDLESLCSTLTYCLLDPKRSVRHACLECIAYLAQCLGAGKLQPLFMAIDTLEKSNDTQEMARVRSAVQARLSRRALPIINDNLVEYALQLPNLNASLRNGSLPTQIGADIDWILAGSGSGGNSARASMKLEDLESSSRQNSATHDGKRHLSTSKATKLPWDDKNKPSVESGVSTPEKGSATWGSNTLPRSSRHSKPKDDILLASVNFNGTSEGAYGVANEHDKTERSFDPEEGYAAAATSTPVKAPFSKPAATKSNAKEFNNSWPISANAKGDSQTTQGSTAKPSGKLVLNPLTADAVPYKNTWTSADSLIEDPTPVLVKNASKKSKVPPISKSDSPTPDEVFLDNNGNELPKLENGKYINLVTLNASLSKIRNSASKKKAEKLFEKLEHKESEADTEATQSNKATNSKQTAPFEKKPKLARHSSQNMPNAEQNSPLELNSSPIRTRSNNRTDESPLPKTENKSKSRSSLVTPSDGESLVAVVGRGYGEDHVETPPKDMTKHKRNSKPSLPSPGHNTAAAMIPISQCEDANLVTVGRGMFEDEARNKPERSTSNHNEIAIEPRHTQEESDEELNNLQIARALRENAAKRKKEKQEESAARHAAKKEQEEQQRLEELDRARLEQEQAEERRRKQQEAVERRRKEAEQKRKEQQAARAEAARNEALLADAGITNTATTHTVTGTSINGASGGAGETPVRTVQRRLSNTKQSTRISSPPPSAAAGGLNAADESFRPLSKPEMALREAMRLISNEDWNDKCDGINKIRRLAACHQDFLTTQLHSVTHAMLNEVKNLRSQVSRLAIIGLGDMFTSLRKAMDSELDTCAKVLLHKNGESNDFIRSELDKTLGSMVSESTPQKCMAAFISGGAQHKNVVIRKVVAQHMVTLCDKLGPGRILSGVKDLTDRVIPTIVQLSLDPSAETRWYAKKMLLMLMQHSEFESLLQKYTPTKDYRTVRDVVDALRQKGLGEMPSDIPSAKPGRRSGSFNRGSRTNSAETVSDPMPSSVRRRVVPPSAIEEIQPLLEAMSSNNWSDRFESINTLVDFIENKPRVVSAHSLKIFDKYAALMKDSNSKVVLHALESMKSRILPRAHNDVAQGSLYLLLQNTALNLASKTREIFIATSELIDTYVNTIDHVTLFQPFVQVAKNCTAKTKADIIDRVSYLSNKVYKLKQKTVILHALPLAWDLVKSSITTSAAGPLRSATEDFVRALYGLMGPSLFEHAMSAPGSTAQMVDRVKQMCSAIDS